MVTGLFAAGRDTETPLFDFNRFPPRAIELLRGFCTVFAAVLSEKTGYQTYAVYTYDDDIEDIAMVHAFCISDDGSFVDVRGAHPDIRVFLEAFEDEVDLSDDEIDLQCFSYDPRALIEEYPDRTAAAREMLERFPDWYGIG